MANTESEPKQKKLLEQSFASSLVIPIAIVLVASSIIFGVTKMLSTERDYKDLVREMHSKTFGNRWIAALELSKVLAASKVPEGDIPWLIENLSEMYDGAKDPRTRDFIIVAMGTLENNLALPIFEKGLSDNDPNVLFHSIVALGNMPKGIEFNWQTLIPLLNSKDLPVVQATILTVATHRVEDLENNLQSLLGHSEISIRYAAATGLIYFKNAEAINVLREILALKTQDAAKPPFKHGQVVNLKFNILNALLKNNWTALNTEVKDIAAASRDLSIAARAREVIIQLKN
jgi:HEAT repeat protein